MSTFQLTIVTPDGEYYHGPAESLTVRATTGELTLLPRHIDFVTALGMGEARVTIDGQKRYAACIGGMLSVVDGAVTLVPTTFEWSDKIDVERANAAYDKADKVLKNPNASQNDLKLAEAKLRRALVRKSVASTK